MAVTTGNNPLDRTIHGLEGFDGFETTHPTGDREVEDDGVVRVLLIHGVHSLDRFPVFRKGENLPGQARSQNVLFRL
jgi:hypothetical protein